MVENRCCCCAEPGLVKQGYTIMKLDPSSGVRIWWNNCEYVATSKPSELFIASNGDVLHTGFQANAANSDSLKYGILSIDADSGTTKEQPRIDGTTGGDYGTILEADNYYYVCAVSATRSLVIDKSDFTATRITGGATGIRKNNNVATWGDYTVRGDQYSTNSAILYIGDTDGSQVDSIAMGTGERMVAFNGTDTDGKLLVWYTDTSDNAKYAGMFDLTSETYDDELELTDDLIGNDSTETFCSVNGSYAAVTKTIVTDPLSSPVHDVVTQVVNLTNMTSLWTSSYEIGTGFGYLGWQEGPVRVSSDGLEVARLAGEKSPADHAVAVFNSTGLKWRKVLTGYTIGTADGTVDLDFDSDGNVYVNGTSGFDDVIIKLNATTGAIEWERDFTFTDNPNGSDVSRITAHGDGIYVCGTKTEPYHI